MKKFLALILLFSLLPHASLASNTENPQENTSEIIEIEDFSFLFENFINIKTAQKMISHFENHWHFDKKMKNNSFGTLVTREFAVFMAIEQMEVDIINNTTPLDNNFSDIDEENFFAPYIAFARKNNIIKGYDDGTFRPKYLINRDEFEKIVANAFDYKTKTEIVAEEWLETEENLILSSASDEENPEIIIEENIEVDFYTLSEIQNLIENIVPFEHTTSYPALEDAFRIIWKQEGGKIIFPKIENLEGYTLYFDYFGMPFLSKNNFKISETEIAEIMTAKINEYRESHGLPRLATNLKLQMVAEKYAKQMFEEKYFEHRDRDGKNVGDRALEENYDYQIVLENLGKWQTNIDQVMSEWKASPTHHKNILDPRVDEVGIGFYGNYWVQVFGKEF